MRGTQTLPNSTGSGLVSEPENGFAREESAPIIALPFARDSYGWAADSFWDSGIEFLGRQAYRPSLAECSHQFGTAVPGSGNESGSVGSEYPLYSCPLVEPSPSASSSAVTDVSAK